MVNSRWVTGLVSHGVPGVVARLRIGALQHLLGVPVDCHGDSARQHSQVAKVD